MRILLKATVLLAFATSTVGVNHNQELDVLCHSENIWREARGESVEGQQLVYWTVVNRGGHPCETIWKPHQFSWTATWNRVYKHPTTTRELVRHLKTQPNPWPNVTHYHNHKVVPHWSKNLTKATTIGNHTFYYDKPIPKQ